MKDIDGYITKDDLYRLISHIKRNPDNVVNDETCRIIVVAISKMPAADVQPVRHGRWIDDKTCSSCGFDILYNYGISGTGFCPNCGADMRGDPDV